MDVVGMFEPGKLLAVRPWPLLSQSNMLQVTNSVKRPGSRRLRQNRLGFRGGLLLEVRAGQCR